MKKIVGISLFIFLAAVTAIIATGFLFGQNNPDPQPFVPNSVGPITLNAQEIGKHSTQSDCWMIINNKVYNFTSYLGAHPGNASSMLPYCGKDGSQGFATKDKSSPQSHSGFADSLLVNYYLGDLNQVIDQPQAILQSPLPVPNSNDPAPSLSSSPSAGSSVNIILNVQEIAKHSTISNCWIIMNNKVYNITNYLMSHPGGVGAISPYCGKDGTQAFQGLPHSPYASTLLNSYFVGNLNQTATIQQVQQNAQNTAQVTPPPRRGGDDEWDD
jgi:cytochrome b involved in lipid metabolism